MFGATFNLVHAVSGRSPVIFGTMKDGNLENNRLALNIFFSDRNVYQNGVNTLSEMVLKNGFVCLFVCFFFFVKNSKFCIVRTIRFCSNFIACGPNTYQIMYEETLEFQCQH